MTRLAMIAALLIVSCRVFAIDTGKAFDDPEMEARYREIIAEVRCVKCQNQTIKDSDALIAKDLRREIRRLLTEGKTDAEIFDFLVTRYGEFVLYRPLMSGVTLLLWIAPGVLLLIGGVIVFRVVRKRMKLPVDIDDDTNQVAG